MGDLDDGGGGEHRVVVRTRAGLGGQQHQERAEALAAGGQQVARGLGDVGRATAGVVEEILLDAGETSPQPVGQRAVDDRQGQVGRTCR